MGRPRFLPDTHLAMVQEIVDRSQGRFQCFFDSARHHLSVFADFGGTHHDFTVRELNELMNIQRFREKAEPCFDRKAACTSEA